MDYLIAHWDRVGPRFVEHLQLCGLTLGIALLIALPLGLLLSRYPRLAGPVVVVLSIIYTIPSLALFAFMIPFLGLGTTTAVTALVAYSQFALVRNVIVAFRGIDPAVLEAARAMGMTGGQVLRQVEIPLALPIILAGIRIAALVIISLATIAAWIGAGGPGQILLNGVSQNHPSEVLAGVICVAALAIATDLVFRLIERWAGGYRRPAVPTREQVAEVDLPEHV